VQWDLDRFLVAQERGIPGGDRYESALKQLRDGHKTTHWMWYVFPQLLGLGSSDRARHFAIVSLEEARAYVAHPVLGARLLECARALLATEGLTVDDIFEHPDELKLRSCMTLFLRAEPQEPLFRGVLDRFFDGEQDERTNARLEDKGLPIPELLEPQ
jgi:uncharacterized protein (DUF1810 family)